MKVNISGRGIIPGMGVIPPVYGREMSEKQVARLLNFESFKVYETETGLIITKKNISSMFKRQSTTVVIPPASKDVMEPTKTTTQPMVEEMTTEDVNFSNLPEITNDDVTTEDLVCETVSTDETNEEIKEESSNENNENKVNQNNNYNRNRNKNKKHK